MKINFQDLIIKETPDYFFVNKPPGLSVLADRSEPTHLLEEARKFEEDLQACHRIDKDTSGVILFSRNNDAYRNAAIQFETRKVSKTYHAIVDGRTSWKKMELSQPIRVSNQSITINESGKEAITYFSTLEIFKFHSLIECLPLTGRMHQIRIHLSHLGHPIVADSAYGGNPFFLSEVKRNYNLKKWTDERPLMARVALHALNLELKDMEGKSIKADAPYPKDFDASIRQLRKNR